MEGGSGTRYGTNGDREALLGQVVHELEEPGSFFAEPVVDGHGDVVEEELGGVLGVEPHLVEVPAPLEPIHAVLHDEQGEAGVRVI